MLSTETDNVAKFSRIISRVFYFTKSSCVVKTCGKLEKMCHRKCFFEHKSIKYNKFYCMSMRMTSFAIIWAKFLCLELRSLLYSFYSTLFMSLYTRYKPGVAQVYIKIQSYSNSNQCEKYKYMKSPKK